MKHAAKRTSEVFDSYQDKYSDAVNRSIAFTGMNVDFFTRVKASYILDFCDKSFSPGGALQALDVGCGIGNFHGILATRFATLSGVDISTASIDRAKARHPSVDYQVYDGERLPFPDGSFDLVFTVCVMHHVDPGQWLTFVGEMYRVLRTGGWALVFEHNPRNLLTLRAVNNCPFDADAVLLRSEKVKDLMNNSKLEDVRSKYILSVPAAGKFMRKIDGLFANLPFGAQYYVCGRKS